MVQQVEQLPELPPPAEILDLADQEGVSFKVTRWEVGKSFITPRGAPAGRWIRTLRMHVSAEDKPAGAPYWDATAGNLVARLEPMLPAVVSAGRTLRVMKHGIAPYARHQVDVL